MPPQIRSDGASAGQRWARFALPAAILSNICLCCGPLLVRLAGSESGVGPAASGLWRLALAAPLLALMGGRGTREVVALGRHGLLLLTTGGLFFAADLACWHVAILHTRLGNAALFGNMAAFTFPIYGFLVARSLPRGGQAVGFVLAMVGTGLLLGRSAELSPRNLIGDLLAIGAGLFYTVYLIVIDRVRGRLGPVPMLFAMTVSGILPMLAFALFMGDPIWPTGPWWPLVVMALTSQVIGQGLLAFAVGHLPPLVVGLSLLLQPVILAAVGGLFYGERLALPDYLGGLALCVALILVRRAPPPEERALA
ncbi:DMT family transporter [Sphingomonas naphthae]|uniref:DMT family transporter n=1 Tax=Sphingomonas naphthae TaxID=1813468 RepID=A0ABY7TJ55_9SPHN|nr:DMT family transporter [Sphingomonas naphthae]WCT72981.1 DMT family transporter [Sphingomonas naphthae]